MPAMKISLRIILKQEKQKIVVRNTIQLWSTKKQQKTTGDRNATEMELQ